MGDILNFSPDRKLEFDVHRPLEFDSRRPLEFDARRDLEFHVNRDLGFGRRGVVFRGYVCPICGALVSPDANRCNECGTVFDGGPRVARPPTASPATHEARSVVPKKAEKVPTPTTVYCAFCGVKLKRSDAFCWNCGARSTGSSEVVRLPARKTSSVTKDWRSEK